MVDIEPEVHVALVVPEENVVARAVLLDQVVLEDERFLFGARHHEVEVHGALEEKLDLVAPVGPVAEVVRRPGPEVLCLAHVEHLAPRVLEEVDPGLPGEGLDAGAKFFGEGFGNHCDRWAGRLLYHRWKGQSRRIQYSKSSER
ncbi:MAG: hypothetical protein H6Q78_1798, partial [Candidatus Krumholzibacteriota bacterium]|nr:hypothetical protein [Candidatus Krumholzibacteriota bacterium]